MSQDAVAGTPNQTPSVDKYVQFAQRALQVGVGGGNGGGGGGGSNSSTRIPTISQITINLQPIYSKKVIADSFSLENFSQGGLINKGFL
jgi:hypothetical protein